MTTLLIDAINILITQPQEDDFESRILNTELADYLLTRSEQIIVVTNARGDRGKKIRDLTIGYGFEYHSMDNTTSKTDPEYRAHAMMYYGRNPEDCFCIEYTEENLVAAAEVGIQGELFVDNTQAIELLRSL
jgi:FMN phosphatase YigB (HAD superfamily)